MSIEITFYPKEASKKDLKAFLEQMSFSSCEHLWDWPADSLHYWWYESEDFKSFDGVEATIYPRSEEEKVEYHEGSWSVHTRTRSSASLGDRNYQNAVIREARKKFGGSFYNDWYGKNRYTPPNEDLRDAVARGIYLSYEHVTSKISAVRFALPKPNEGLERMVGTDLEALAAADPTRVLYNALIPFAVAAVEHFFSQSFKILLRYDRNAQERLLAQSKKIEIQDALAIRDGKKSIEDVVADWYSFQNISSIHSAFSDWFNLDFWKLIRKRKKIGSRMPLLEHRLNQIIQFRHGLVHRFEIDLQLRKGDIEEVFDLVVALIDIFVDEIEKQRACKIRD